VTRISFRHFLLAASTALVAGVALTCGDPLGLPPVQRANEIDTTTLFALQGTDIAAPSGFDIVNASRSRTDLAQPFDMAFDIDADDRALLFPAAALGLVTEAALQETNQAFGAINRAPTDGYQSDSALVLRQGLVFLARSRAASQFCSFLGAIPRFGKFRVLAIDQTARTVTLELLVNVNCGYRSLDTGEVND